MKHHLKSTHKFELINPCLTGLALTMLFILACSAPLEHQAISSLNQRIATANLQSHQVNSTLRRESITLEGFVSSSEDSKTIERIALSTPGVRTVHNKLVVQSSSRSPSALSQTIKNQLSSQLTKNSYDIQLREKKDKTIEVSGRASSHEIAQQILEIIKGTPGVLGVQNNLMVKSLEISDSEIQRQVVRSLASEFPNIENKIQVGVTQGVVKLAGSLDSQREIDQVLSHTLMQDGVKSVSSSITIGEMPYQTGLVKKSS